AQAPPPPPPQPEMPAVPPPKAKSDEELAQRLKNRPTLPEKHWLEVGTALLAKFMASKKDRTDVFSKLFPQEKEHTINGFFSYYEDNWPGANEGISEFDAQRDILGDIVQDPDRANQAEHDHKQGVHDDY